MFRSHDEYIKEKVKCRTVAKEGILKWKIVAFVLIPIVHLILFALFRRCHRYFRRRRQNQPPDREIESVRDLNQENQQINQTETVQISQDFQSIDTHADQQENSKDQQTNKALQQRLEIHLAADQRSVGQNETPSELSLNHQAKNMEEVPHEQLEDKQNDNTSNLLSEHSRDQQNGNLNNLPNQQLEEEQNVSDNNLLGGRNFCQ